MNRKHLEKAQEATRFKVYDQNDKLVGVWYSRTADEAIRNATAQGYNAWRAQPPLHAFEY